VAILLGCVSGLRAQSRIAWVDNWAEAQSLARSQHRLILIHFWSQSCPPCLKLERTVYNRPEMIRAMHINYIPLKINVMDDPEMARRHDIRRWPTDVIVDADGKEVHRGPSPLELNEYIATLDQIAAHARIGLPVSGSASTARAPDPSMSPQSSFPLGNQAQAVANRSAQAAPPSGAAVASYRANPYAQEEQQNQGVPAMPGYGGQFQPPRGPAASTPPAAMENRFVGRANPPASRTGPNPNATPAVSNQPTNPAPALDGYCPVTLVEQEKWVKGDVKWGAHHRGRTYLFAGPEQQKRFMASFDKYAPALSGFDAVKYVEQGVLVDGKRAHGVFYKNQIFLFADETALRQFWTAPERYASNVRAEQARTAPRGQQR
jgi:protein disulfide-isomerase